MNNRPRRRQRSSWITLVQFGSGIALAFWISLGPSVAADCPLVSLDTKDKDLDAAIAVCGSVIRAKEAAHDAPLNEYDRRADAYLYRGRHAQKRAGSDATQARRAQDDFRRAIADATKCAQLWEAKAIKETGSLYGTSYGFKQSTLWAGCYRTRGLAHVSLSQLDDNLADLDDAISDFKKFVEGNDGDYAGANSYLVDTYLLKVRLLAKKGNYRGSIAELDAAILANENPKYPKENMDGVRLRKGAFYERLGELDQAAAEYNDVLRTDPNNVEAYFRRGRLRLGQGGDLEVALSDLSAAIDVFPDVAEYRVTRSKARLMLGDADGAIADLDVAIASAPDAESYLLRAQARRGKGDLPGALADLNAAINRNRNMATAYFERGFVKAARRDFDGALADFDDAIRLDPKSPTYLTLRGVVWGMKGNRDREIADFGAAIALDPSDAQHYANRAWALFKSGKLEDALSDANRALTREPGLAGALAARGHIYEALGRADEAVADFKAALAIAPAMADAKAALQRLSARP